MFKKLIGLIMLILLVFGGFYVYRMHENVKHVMSYEAEVEKTLKAQGLSGDTKLALAIIYTETKGKQVDIMQSSESLNGKTNTFSTEEESIKQGIANLSKVLEYASEKKVDAWTGSQNLWVSCRIVSGITC